MVDQILFKAISRDQNAGIFIFKTILIILLDMASQSGFTAGGWTENYNKIRILLIGLFFYLILLHGDIKLIINYDLITCQLTKIILIKFSSQINIMRLKSLISNFKISTRKFYQIVAQKQKEILPSTPEQFVISKYLHERNIDKRIDRNIQVKKPNSIPKYQNNLVNYQQIIQKYPHGSLIQKRYKDVDFNLLSINFQKISLKQLYQVFQQFSPDLILVQSRPQTYLPYFQQIIKSQGVFSDKLYLEQILIEEPEKIKQYVLSQPIIKKFDEIFHEKKNQSSQNDKIYIKDNKGAIDDSVILAAAYYAKNSKKAIIFGDVPELPWREWICNSHTLMEIQELFKNIAKNFPFYQSLGFTLQQLGSILKPQLFLNLRDRYMATLIEMIISTKKYKKVLCLMGVMQNQAVMQILERQLLINQNPQTKQQVFTPLLQYLIGPPIKSSLLRNIQGWQIIQKHIIFDILHHGEQIMQIPFESLSSTNRIINHYGIHLNSYSQDNIMKFRYDKSLQYLKLMRSQIKQGRELREKFMLRQAMRQSEDSY